LVLEGGGRFSAREIDPEAWQHRPLGGLSSTHDQKCREWVEGGGRELVLSAGVDVEYLREVNAAKGGNSYQHHTIGGGVKREVKGEKKEKTEVGYELEPGYSL